MTNHLSASTGIPRPERPSREFERLVNEDLRDKYAAGPAYAVLSRQENLIRWLQTLTDIRSSILAQNAHDNAALRTHPNRVIGGEAPKAYMDAKKAVDDRKRARERALQAVQTRIGEVRRLIGDEQIRHPTAGIMAHRLVDIDAHLQDGKVEDARAKIAALLRVITAADCARGEQ